MDLRWQPVDELVHGSTPLEAHPSGRCCAHPACVTTLSRYNPDQTCQAHGGWSDATVKRPGRRARTPPRGGSA